MLASFGSECEIHVARFDVTRNFDWLLCVIDKWKKPFSNIFHIVTDILINISIIEQKNKENTAIIFGDQKLKNTKP